MNKVLAVLMVGINLVFCIPSNVMASSTTSASEDPTIKKEDRVKPNGETNLATESKNPCEPKIKNYRYCITCGHELPETKYCIYCCRYGIENSMNTRDRRTMIENCPQCESYKGYICTENGLVFYYCEDCGVLWRYKKKAVKNRLNLNVKLLGDAFNLTGREEIVKDWIQAYKEKHSKSAKYPDAF